MDLFLSQADLKRMKKDVTRRRPSKSFSPRFSSSSRPVAKQPTHQIFSDRSRNSRADQIKRLRQQLPTAVAGEKEEESAIAATPAEEVSSSSIVFAPREPRRNSAALMPPPAPPRRPVTTMPKSDALHVDVTDVLEKVARKCQEELETLTENLIVDSRLSNDDICLMLSRATQIVQKNIPASKKNGINSSTATIQSENASAMINGLTTVGSLSSDMDSQPSHFLLKDWQLLKSDDGGPGLRLRGTLCNPNNKVIMKKFVTENVTNYDVNTQMVSSEDGEAKFIPVGRCTNYHSLPAIVRNYFSHGFSGKWQKAAKTWDSLL